MTSFHPLYVVQELSARCYAGCPGCFREFVSGDFDGDMTEEIFEAANAEIPSGTMILPQFHGESLLHPHFGDFMKRYKDLDLRISIPISGGAGEKWIPHIVGEGTPAYIVIFSVDGYQPRTHGVRRGAISLERVERFVDEAMKQRGDRKTPKIAVRWVEGGQSEIEFEMYLRKWLFDKGVDFVLRSRMFNYGSPMNSTPLTHRGKCHALLEGAPVVLFNGDVLLCERVADRKKWVIGNVLKDSWNTMMKRREEMVGDYPNNPPCDMCSAAYILTGYKGMIQLRHHEQSMDVSPIYIHNDHSQEFYSREMDWKGINWNLKTQGDLEREENGGET